ncbi:MAG: DUF3102 domain-containing protein, partial [Peptostreptococcaceae bacterium]|nr:DUF3102 domain-containing protein [Peptostreptococcaceae bacterium]
MNEVIDVECNVVKSLPVMVAEIKAIEETVFRVTLEGVVRIGEKLKVCKEEVPHGEWSTWCEENLGYSQRQAQKYMELSERYSDETGLNLKTKTYSFLSISKAYSLLSLPEEEAETFVKENDVTDMTVKNLQEEIKRKNDELLNSEMEIRASKALATTFDKEIEEKDNTIRDLEAKLQEVGNISISPEEAKYNEKTISDLNIKLDKAKQEKAKAIEDKEDAVNKAISEVEAKTKYLTEEANKRISEAKAETEKKVEEAIRKANATSDPTIAEFKLRVDIMQNDFSSCLAAVNKVESEEMKSKLNKALLKVMNQLKERISE